jgi:ABC-type uncharacterized transport system auxiliary subunit
MKREPWRTWKTPDILRVKALDEYLWAKRAEALDENDIAKAFRYTDRFMAISSRGNSMVMRIVSSAR